MAKTPLRSVAPDEKPTSATDPPKPKTLVEAVATGNYREILLAQQREIATTVGDEKGPAKAALHRQLAIISKELEALNAAAEEDDDGDPVEDEAFDSEAL